MNLDKEIKQFIDDIPDDYGFSKDDAKYISGYTGCELPPFVYNSFIQDFIKKEYPFINLFPSTSEPVNALCYGYGSLAVLSNTNCVIKCYQEDYYCFRVTQAQHYNEVSTGEQSVTFRNMATYFTNYKGNNHKYNIVVVFPHKTEYQKVDSNPAFANLSSYAYYTLRGAYFLKPDGILVALVPKQYAYEIKSNEGLIAELNATLTITEEGDYAIIQIKK